MAEWEAKINAIIKETAKENVTGLLGVLMDIGSLNRLIEDSSGKTLMKYAQCRSLLSRRVSFRPYRKQFEALFCKHNIQYYEIYNASKDFLPYKIKTI